VQTLRIAVSKIDMDLLNPRHKSNINTQEKIIEHLCENDNVKELAKDISTNGLSPIDLIAVIQDHKENRYVVVEGNRRICALKLLNKPSKSKKYKAYFERIQNNNTAPPSKITALLFDSREQANTWIERRHSGVQNGVGTNPWNATQKSQFNIVNLGKNDTNALALAVIQYAEHHLGFDGLEDKVQLTTATRFVSNPYFRNTLGLRGKSTSSELSVDVDLNEFNQGITSFCNDLIKNKEVNSRANKSGIESYAKSLIANGMAPTTRSPKPYVVEHKKDQELTDIPNIKNPNIKDAPLPITEKKDSFHPNNRKHLIPSSFSAKINDHILRRAYQELKEVNIDEHTLASTLVLRVFLENLYERYHMKIQGNHTEMDTNKRLTKIIAIIESDESLVKAQKNALAALRRVLSTGHILSPKTLGANAHGGFYPTASDIKKEWDNISEIVQYMLNKIV